MVFNQGLGGPKVNPKGAADGQSVNIPILGYFSDEKTQYSSSGGLMDFRSYTKVNQGVRKVGFIRRLE